MLSSYFHHTFIILSYICPFCDEILTAIFILFCTWLLIIIINFVKVTGLYKRTNLQTYSPHWSNETTMIQYVERILLQYVKAKSFNFHQNIQLQLSLTIFPQKEYVVELLDDNHVRIAMVPPNHINQLRPLSVNKAVKIFTTAI